jgi:hypothetical protein
MKQPGVSDEARREMREQEERRQQAFLKYEADLIRAVEVHNAAVRRAE